MDLEILMQEDRTDITGAVLYSADIFNASTAEGVATHVLVRLPPCSWCHRTKSFCASLRQPQAFCMSLQCLNTRGIRVPALVWSLSCGHGHICTKARVPGACMTLGTPF